MQQAVRGLLALASAAALLAAWPGGAAAQDVSYRLVENWAHVPPGFEWGEIADAQVDAGGNLWVLHRPPTPGGTAWKSGRRSGGEDPVLMFDSARRLEKSFGRGLFLQPHGLHVDPEGNVWVTDSGPFYEEGRSPGKGYQVVKFDRDGRVLMTLGKAGVSAPGRDTFVAPTDVVVNDRGEIFVADGHTPRPGPQEGDRIVKLAPDGTFLASWAARRGAAPGEVTGPHRMALDSRGRLFVADRGNRRIQIFDQDGGHLDAWTQFGNPSGIWIDRDDVLYVAVAGQDGGIRIGSAKDGSIAANIPNTSPEVVTVDSEGRVYAGLVGGMRLEQYARK